MIGLAEGKKGGRSGEEIVAVPKAVDKVSSHMDGIPLIGHGHVSWMKERMMKHRLDPVSLV